MGVTYRELGERPEQVEGVWTLPIGDGEVTQINIDYAFGLVVHMDTVVRFETPFEWFDGTETRIVEPGSLQVSRRS